MKSQNIYVGINGSHIVLNSGSKGIAVIPPNKGENFFYLFTDKGTMSQMKGSRLYGKGVKTWLKENGFALAQPSDETAARFADLLDVREGLKLVEDIGAKTANYLQELHSASIMRFVPFDSDKPMQDVTVEPNKGYVTVVFDLESGITAPGVRIEYTSGVSNMLHASLTQGWLVPVDSDTAVLPRGTEYGGVMEQAVYTICNCGLAKLNGANNLEFSENSAEFEQFPRGVLEMVLPNGDQVFVGSDAGDELAVDYRRAGVSIYKRSGMEGLRLGDVVGSIAAVFVRVAELDALPVKKVKKAA